MLRIFLLSLFITLALALGTAHANNTKPTLKDAKGITTLLPVNVFKKGERINLLVKIPKNFKPLQDNLDPFLEFIPENEEASHWSQIITTQTLVGKNIDASAMTDHLRKMVFSQGKNAKVISNTVSTKDGYKCATLVISYTTTRPEVLVAQYYSGPSDCSGFQYTSALSTKTSEKEALDRAANFIKNNTSIIKA